MIKEAIIKLSKKDLMAEAEAIMELEIMDGAATPVQMASYLTALSLKETRDHCISSRNACTLHQASPRYECSGDRRNRW